MNLDVVYLCKFKERYIILITETNIYIYGWSVVVENSTNSRQKIVFFKIGIFTNFFVYNKHFFDLIPVKSYANFQ